MQKKHDPKKNTTENCPAQALNQIIHDYAMFFE